MKQTVKLKKSINVDGRTVPVGTKLTFSNESATWRGLTISKNLIPKIAIEDENTGYNGIEEDAKQFTVKDSKRTFGEFLSWYNAGSPSARDYDSEPLYDNGGFDTFDELEEMEAFTKKHKNTPIGDVTVTDQRNDFEIEFTIAGKDFVIAALPESEDIRELYRLFSKKSKTPK